jgi:SNF2 family DNA or RNA helicase
MPNLSLEDKGLILSMEDVPDIARDADTKLYFSSILGLEYDGDSSYSYDDTDDFVRTAMLIQRITDYLQDIGLSCKLDQQSSKIVAALVNSENELNQSRERGTEIQEGPAVVPTIPSFVRSLKPYQVRPVNHAVAGHYVANFSVPGSGKTTIAYATFAILRASSIVEKIVVIGPRSSFMPWEEEYESCFGKKPKSLRIVAGNQVGLEDKVEDIELILLTYQMASSITSALIDVLTSYDCLLVLDESHHVKRFGGGLWSNTALRISPYARRRLILTGTPMPNSLLDLWNQFTFLWPFRNLLGEPLAYKGIIEGQDSLERVRQIIRPFYTRITKSQLNLPQASFNEIVVPLNRVQHAIYSAIAAKTLAEIAESPSDRMRLREWRRNKVVRLLQAASNPSLLTEYSEEFRIPPLNVEGMPVVRLIEQYSDYEIPSKIVKAETLTRELLEKGQKVIVWNTFIHNIKTLERMLEDRDPIIIYGDIPKDENEDELVNREKLIREFRTDAKPRVLIANPSSLAESVSLHKVCKHAIYVDRTFNCGQYIQSLDRIHRIGLKPNEKVIYYILVARSTIDEVVDARLGDKYRNMLNVLNDDLPIVDFDTTVSDVSDAEFEKDFQAVRQHLLGLKTGEKSD